MRFSCLYVGVDVESAAIGGYVDGEEYGAEFAVRALIAEEVSSVDARRAGFIEEPTDRAKHCPHIALATTEVVRQLAQDLVDLADMFVYIAEGAVLVMALSDRFVALTDVARERCRRAVRHEHRG